MGRMRILILGAGLMGRGAAFDYLNNPAVSSVVVADASEAALAAIRGRFPDNRLTVAPLRLPDHDRLVSLMKQVDGVFCSVHYGFNLEFTQAAIEAGVHLVDLGGNNDIVAAQRALSEQARKAGVSIIPDCGLAPGLVSMLTAWGVNRFPWADTVKIRVGGLPLDPQPPFFYERLFSVEGLINEYVEPPVALRNGRIETLEALGDLETVEFDPPVGTLEAFNTSGGTSTLPETYGSRLRHLDYKTLRYPGHVAAMRWLLDLGLFSSDPVAVDGHPIAPRRLVAERIAAKVPLCKRDRAVVRVEFLDSSSARKHRLEIIDEFDATNDLTAMMRTTAFPAAIISQMQCDGRIRSRGVLPQELAVDPDLFLAELEHRGIVVKGLAATQ